jgi:hypothetical protein
MNNEIPISNEDFNPKNGDGYLTGWHFAAVVATWLLASALDIALILLFVL